MTPEWLEDGRKVPDDVMYYIRRMAVYAVRVLGRARKRWPKPIILTVRAFTAGLNNSTGAGLRRWKALCQASTPSSPKRPTTG